MHLLMGGSGEAECKQTCDVYNSDKIVNNVEILRNRWLIFRLYIHNFQGSKSASTYLTYIFYMVNK